MPIEITSVRPGDVISSDLMNFILAKLSEIDLRVVTLETGGSSTGQVTITSFVPALQQPAGQELWVNGTFAFPPENNTVTIDGTPITSFRPGTTSSQLRFIIPTTLSIPVGGRNVVVRVINEAGETSALYRVLPAVAAPGDPPAIESVVAADGGPFIFVNQAILISGQNFASDPAENLIRFRLVLAGTPEVVYPAAGETIDINVANSNESQIEATVPDISEIPAGQSRNVTVEVGVGAHVPAVRVVPIRRPA